MLLSLAVCLIFAVSNVIAANILFLFPIPSPSHQVMTKELTKALIAKGHRITMVSPYPLETTTDNYTDVFIDGMFKFREEKLKNAMSYNATFSEIMASLRTTEIITKITLDSPGVQKLLKSNATFDLVIQELMVSAGLLGIGHHYKVPTIALHVIGTGFEIDYVVGNSGPLAYVPLVYAPLTDEMNFLQRMGNVLLWVLIKTLFFTLMLPAAERELQAHFPDAPPIDQLLHNISLILINSHYSVAATPRPYVPNLISIGGLHIQPQQLPANLQNYLDGAKEGAVLFSLGSNIETSGLPQDKINAILNTFNQFPQKFLLKFENDSLDVPENVKVFKWLPQRAVLNHPNTRALVTHGGLFSISEAVYYCVPFVGIPAFGDQLYNMAVAVQRKIGIKLDISELNEETFTHVLKEILEDHTYQENIKHYSALFRDQPIDPLDHAVYWIEHVIKHKGAAHLQNAGVKLAWYQSYLLDVIAFICGIVAMVLYLNYMICRKIFTSIRRRIARTKRLKSS